MQSSGMQLLRCAQMSTVLLVSTQATNSTEVAGRDHAFRGVLVQCSGPTCIQCTLLMLNCRVLPH